MALVKGRDFLIKISDGLSPAAFLQLGALRTNSLSINNRPVDVSNKDTVAGFTAWDSATAIKDFQASGEGFFESGSAGIARLRTVALSSDPSVPMEFLDGSGAKFSGTFVVEAFQMEGEVEGPVRYTASFRNKGDVTYA